MRDDGEVELSTDGRSAVLELKDSYDVSIGDAQKFCAALLDQLSALFSSNGLKAAIQPEYRIKDGPSILTKLDRLSEGWDDIHEVKNIQ